MAEAKNIHPMQPNFWELGRDIVERDAENKYGSAFYATLSTDLKREIPEATGLSERNLRYTKRFYLLYNKYFTNLQQPVAESSSQKMQQLVAKLNIEQDVPSQDGKSITQQVVDQMTADLFSVPWGHHIRIIDTCKDDSKKALFFVHQTVENGWSRDVLLNFLGTDLYERQGHALTNFNRTLPEETSDLAQELTKDPFIYRFLTRNGRLVVTN